MNFFMYYSINFLKCNSKKIFIYSNFKKFKLIIFYHSRLIHVELVKLMVIGEGLNLDDALTLDYAVDNHGREVVKALLELGVADVNCPTGPTGKTPLHIVAEMVCLGMAAGPLAEISLFWSLARVLPLWSPWRGFIPRQLPRLGSSLAWGHPHRGLLPGVTLTEISLAGVTAPLVSALDAVSDQERERIEPLLVSEVLLQSDLETESCYCYWLKLGSTSTSGFFGSFSSGRIGLETSRRVPSRAGCSLMVAAAGLMSHSMALLG